MQLSEVFTLIYHKPNSMKWANLDEIPEVMTEAVILREDRRFRNDIIPVTHRGNDNLVIVPRIAERVALKILKTIYDFSTEYGIILAEKEKCGIFKDS